MLPASGAGSRSPGRSEPLTNTFSRGGLLRRGLPQKHRQAVSLSVTRAAVGGEPRGDRDPAWLRGGFQEEEMNDLGPRR